MSSNHGAKEEKLRLKATGQRQSRPYFPVLWQEIHFIEKSERNWGETESCELSNSQQLDKTLGCLWAGPSHSSTAPWDPRVIRRPVAGLGSPHWWGWHFGLASRMVRSFLSLIEALGCLCVELALKSWIWIFHFLLMIEERCIAF